MRLLGGLLGCWVVGLPGDQVAGWDLTTRQPDHPATPV